MLKGSFLHTYKLFIGLLIAAVIILALFSAEGLQMIQGPKNISEVSSQKLKKQYGIIDIYSVLNRSFSYDGGRYYIVDCGRENYLLLKVDSKSPDGFQYIEKSPINDFLERNMDGDVLCSYLGASRKLNMDEEKLLLLKGNEQEDVSVLIGKTDLYVFVITDTPYGDRLPVIGVFLLGCFLLLAFIFWLVFLLPRGYKILLVKDINKSGKTVSKIEVQEIYKVLPVFKGGLAISEQYLFFVYMGFFRAIPFDSIKFITPEVSLIQIRKNEITNYDLVITLIDGKKYRIKKSDATGLCKFIYQERQDLVYRNFIA